ncbi:small subunit processome component 20 homolog isoform X4 [Perca fluviatilis]|uniref:small subunit processome component 20 homolog isoform X4 n=1 Tax=Perca fluviatilis TaxID=8168 RepID=UPI001965C9F0|nr:small subunit processome component 20 homolog isoform X4 [Perca fluviatilis]
MVFERICQKELNKLPKNPGSCLAAVEKAVAETDVAAVLPLGRQHSLLNIINVLIQKLGHLIHIYLPKVLQILLCVTASVSTLLDNSRRPCRSVTTGSLNVQERVHFRLRCQHVSGSFHIASFHLSAC